MIQVSATELANLKVPAPKPCDRLALAFSAEHRPHVAAQLGAAFVRGELSGEERLVTIEIFKFLAHDTEVEVRQALAEHIRNCPFLPPSLARTLAEDIETVAVPILKSSPLLSDEDLTSIIVAGNTAKQRAIAKRETVSEVVSGALVDTGNKDVIGTLLANLGARISDRSYQSVLDAFRHDTDIQELLVDRPALPFEVKEQLISIVSEALQARLVDRHGFPETLVDQIGRHGQERTLLQTLSALRSGQEIEAAVARLSRKGALTPTLLLRVLSAGLLEHFGAAMAALAGVPSGRAQNALRKAGTPALLSLYERARLPEHLQPAFQVVLEVILERRRTGHTGAQPETERRIVEDLVTTYRMLNPGSLENVICQLGRLSATNPDELRL